MTQALYAHMNKIKIKKKRNSVLKKHEVGWVRRNFLFYAGHSGKHLFIRLYLIMTQKK
jgi:hypothetical protein